MSASPPPYPLAEATAPGIATARPAEAAGFHSRGGSGGSSIGPSPTGSSRSSTMLMGTIAGATVGLSPPGTPGGTTTGVILGEDALNLLHPTSHVTPSSAFAWGEGDASTVPSAREQATEELPPSYDVARTPTAQVSYTFSHQGGNSMLLLPPPGALDPRPLYHVHVSMNCFMPSMFITTLRRGGPTGELVGEFEMGSSQMSESVTIYGKQRSLSAVMKSTKNKIQGYRTSTWYGRTAPPQSPTPFSLKWTTYDLGSQKTCTMDTADRPSTIVARFTLPPISPASDGTPLPPSSITILPFAFEYPGLVDQVIFSALITERLRLR